jgi:PAS domain S-box-containing protein
MPDGGHDDDEASRRFLEAVVENIPHMVFVKDAARLSFVRFNRAGEELLGMSRAELIGKNDYDFFPKEEADFFQAKDRETLANRVRVDIGEEPIETRRGPRVLRTVKVPILDEGGTPLYLLGISEDITERKAGEVATARLAAIVEDSEDAILSHDLTGTITSWNRSAARMFGWSAEEAVGKSIGMLRDTSRTEAEAELDDRIAAGERLSNVEVRRLRKDGRSIDVAVSTSPLYDSSGKRIGVSTIARDVSELKRVHRELVGAKERAEAANRELEGFSYSVAHDLRAPLRSIDGFSRALLEDYGGTLDEKGQKYVRIVRESAELMGHLIDDILTLSRVTRSEIRREKVDLSAMARATCDRLASTSPSRTVDVEVEGGLTALGDARLLEVLFENLLGNAWKFTSKKERAHIEVGAVREASEPAFFVRDDGAGFDMQYADKLFGVFQRLHTASEFEGTGIGLATVQRIVHRHGGRVWAEGRFGRGATFYFTLGEEASS